MNISQAAEQAKLSTKTVRYYADIGLVPAPKTGVNGYRYYDKDLIKKLIFVKRARVFDFSIDECRTLLGLYEDPHRSSRNVKSIAQNKLLLIKEKETELHLLREQLEALVHGCHGNDDPDCPILDYLG